eukprot:6460357-Amphidinium_carterae.2
MGLRKVCEWHEVITTAGRWSALGLIYGRVSEHEGSESCVDMVLLPSVSLSSKVSAISIWGAAGASADIVGWLSSTSIGSSNRPISCCKGGALCALGAGGGNLLRCRASALPATGAASRGGEVPSTCASCRAESAGAGSTPLWMRSLVRLAWRFHSEAGKKEAPSAGGGCCIAELTCPYAEQGLLTLYCSKQRGHRGVLLRHDGDDTCQQEAHVLGGGIAVRQKRRGQKLEQRLELELVLELMLELGRSRCLDRRLAVYSAGMWRQWPRIEAAMCLAGERWSQLICTWCPRT